MADVKALARVAGQVRDTLDADRLLIGGIDYGIAGGTLTIGTVNATALSIGAVGVTATVLGNLSVNGIFTIVDGGSMLGDGDITLGGGDGDTITLGGSWVSADDIVNIGTVNGVHNTTVNLRCSMGVGQDKRINFDRTADSEGALLLPDTKDAPAGLAMGMLRVTAAGLMEWYNGAAWVTVITTAYTIDDAYNAGVATITVDAYDVTWNLTGAFSHVTNLAGCTGNVDGFFVEDGADFFRLTHAAADTLNLSAELGTFDVNTKDAVTVDSLANISLDALGSSNFTITANSAGAEVLTLRCTQAGAGTGEISVYATDDISVRSVDGSVSIRATGPVLGNGISIEADAGGGSIEVGCNAGTNQVSLGGAGARNVYVGSTSATGATIQAEQIAVGISVNSAGAHQIALSAINIGAGTATIGLTADDAVTIDSTAAGISLDAAGASNFSTSAGALTLYGADGVGISGGAGGHVVINADIAKSIAIGNVVSSNIGIGTNATTTTTIGNDAATSVFIRSGGAAGNGLTIDASGAALTAGLGVLALGSIASIDFTDGYKAAGGYAGAFKLAATAAEYTTYEANFGEVSLLNALNQCARGIQILNAAALAFNDFAISTIFVSYTATGACTITIDSDQIARAGRKITIKDSGLNAAANNITLETEGAETIEGEADLIMNADGMSITLQSDGTNLWIV